MAEKLGLASSSSNKWMKEKEIDRLSALPDSLLVGILSLLSTREAIRTSVLSRKWLFLWTDLPVLAFQEESCENEKISKFVGWVHKYIALCGGNHLQRFEVSFRYRECFASDVNAWVQFALKHRVKDVALLFKGWEDDYLLPQMMYSNSYLTCLRLQECIVTPKNNIDWGALTSLYIKNVEFCENVIENILSSCPVLYDLTLEDCWDSSKLDCLHVKSQSLRELTIIGWDHEGFDVANELLMEISAPLIHYARISVCIQERKFELTNISSLVEADIDFEGYKPNFTSNFGYTNRLFEKLHHVKKLKAGSELIWALGDMVVKEGMQLSQSGVECLQLNATIWTNTTHGIVCLLESSPNLKDLSISLWPQYFSQDGLETIELNRDLLRLKTVTITVGEPKLVDEPMPRPVAEPMLTLARLLLKRAPVLEKLVIEFPQSSPEYFSPINYMKIAQTLLSYPRASTKAAVVLAPVKFSC